MAKKRATQATDYSESVKRVLVEFEQTVWPTMSEELGLDRDPKVLLQTQTWAMSLIETWEPDYANRNHTIKVNHVW